MRVGESRWRELLAHRVSLALVRLLGIPIPDGDVRRLVSSLIVDQPELAGRLSRAVDNGTALLALSPDERLAILGVLEEAETEPLAEHRGLLADNAGRRAGF